MTDNLNSLELLTKKYVEQVEQIKSLERQLEYYKLLVAKKEDEITILKFKLKE